MILPEVVVMRLSLGVFVRLETVFHNAAFATEGSSLAVFNKNALGVGVALAFSALILLALALDLDLSIGFLRADLPLETI